MEYGMSGGKTCAFFGHRLWHVLSFDTLFSFVKNLVEEKNITRFLVGNHGKFDALAREVCLRIAEIYPHIEICFVENGKEKHQFPIGVNVKILNYFVEQFHFKARITQTNRCIVDDCDIVVCWVDMNIVNSGARRAVVYAQKQGKEIFNLYDATLP